MPPPKGSLESATESQVKLCPRGLVYGIYDLAAHWQFEKGRTAPDNKPLTEKMLGGLPSDDPLLYRLASPLHLVDCERTKDVKALVAWGSDDDVVAPQQSQAFAAALAAAGAIARTQPVANAGHYWFSKESPWDPDSRAGTAVPQLLDFLGAHL